MPYNSIQMFFRYINYLKNSKTRYRVHSPFVYSLVEQVIRKQPPFYAFEKIEKWRDELIEDVSEVNLIDLGAGSRRTKSRSVSDIANTALSTKHQSEWLFGLVNYFEAKTIVELGTSLGVSTAYLAAASNNSLVHTFEGSPELIAIAKKGWQKLKLNNIYSVEGPIDETLPKFMTSLKEPIDLLYMDANHTYEATMKYYKMLQPNFNPSTVVVVDDVHWSVGMQKAWREISNSKEVSISIDLFYKGLLFFRKDIEKEHFVLRV